MTSLLLLQQNLFVAEAAIHAMYNTERPNWTELRVDTLYLLLTEHMAIRGAMQQLS